MNDAPTPLVFSPLFMSRPWGGRRLAAMLQKDLPAGDPIGESWELVDLPEAQSTVARGPQRGAAISKVLNHWGPRLTGSAALVGGRFPLLLKFLDADQDLSIQLHPRPTGDPAIDGGRVKHEAWVVLFAEPKARILAGCHDGVSAAQFAEAFGTAQAAKLLKSWPAKLGDCFYLPSGIPHCLGAGIVVAEIQTPSDITYRVYDWDRLGLDGKRRDLHREESLANLLLSLPDEAIVQQRRHVGGGLATVTHLCACERFSIDRARMSEGYQRTFGTLEPLIWMVLRGDAALRGPGGDTLVRRGDVVLIPAENANLRAEIIRDMELIEITIPVESSLNKLPRPERETPPAEASGFVKLTKP